jgi:hypothetical protein
MVAARHGGVADIIDADQKMKWSGLRREDLVLSHTPSKTNDTTEKKISFRLADAPMVVEELELWPADKRTGPLVILEATCLPSPRRP